MSDEDEVAFEAEIREARGGGALVEVPFRVEERFGTRGRVRIRARFDGHEYRGSLAPMGGGRHVLGIRKDIRAAIGKGVGDRIRVTLVRDTEPRTVEVPSELGDALERSPEAAQRFERLTFTHRREYAEWVSEARRQETRERRAAEAVSMLLEGRTR